LIAAWLEKHADAIGNEQAINRIYAKISKPHPKQIEYRLKLSGMVSKTKQLKGRKRVRAKKPSLYRVFISHSSLDKWVAERMAEKVVEAGADFWLDVRDLPGGGDIRKEINQGVQECQEVIILFSPNSVNSHWVSFEIGAAYAKRKHLTPILNNVNYTDVSLLQGIKAIELNNFGQYLTELKKRINKRTKKRK
jgi:TIR domain